MGFECLSFLNGKIRLVDYEVLTDQLSSTLRMSCLLETSVKEEVGYVSIDQFEGILQLVKRGLSKDLILLHDLKERNKDRFN